MHVWRSRELLLVCLAALAVGCGGRQQPKTDDGRGERLAENIRQEKRGEETVTEYDLNNDGKPDMWTYTVTGKDPEGRPIERIVRRELDINWDGKVDIVRHYDEREQISREALDLDFDGRVDQTNFYEKGQLVRKERDLDYDGRTDLWIFFERGKIVRREQDTNSDGRVDYWEYWENDQVERIGEDLDGDGQVDRWTRNPQAEGAAR
jgi:hypothetical protein